jgi:hypothetical protein
MYPSDPVKDGYRVFRGSTPGCGQLDLPIQALAIAWHFLCARGHNVILLLCLIRGRMKEKGSKYHRFSDARRLRDVCLVRAWVIQGGE